MNYVTFETSMKMVIGPCSPQQVQEVLSFLDRQLIDCSVVTTPPLTGKKINADSYILQNKRGKTEKIAMKDIAEMVKSDQRNRSICVSRGSITFKAHVAIAHGVRVTLNSDNQIVEQYRDRTRIFKSLEAYREFLLR